MRDVGVIVMLAVRRALSDPTARRRLIAGLVRAGRWLDSSAGVIGRACVVVVRPAMSTASERRGGVGVTGKAVTIRRCERSPV
jgi:hypothetical protein